MAGFPSENAGIDAIPLLFRLTVAPAFNFVFELSACSFEYEAVNMNKNTTQNETLIFIMG